MTLVTALLLSSSASAMNWTPAINHPNVVQCPVTWADLLAAVPDKPIYGDDGGTENLKGYTDSVNNEVVVDIWSATGTLLGSATADASGTVTLSGVALDMDPVALAPNCSLTRYYRYFVDLETSSNTHLYGYVFPY